MATSKKARGKGSGNVGRSFSGFDRHVRRGTKLLNPMHDLPLSFSEWDRDWLPEHLWLGSLAVTYREREWPGIYNAFMDAIDEVCEHSSVPLGFISDFGLVPEGRRAAFLQDHAELARIAFQEPFGRVAAFYPDGPAHWLVDQAAISAGGRLDPEVELQRLSDLVMKLFPGRDLFAGHIRSVPLNRILKHDKIRITRDLAVVELLGKYPWGCSEEEQYRVQQNARMTINIMCQTSGVYACKKWPKYFWRHNWDLAPCVLRESELSSPAREGRQNAASLAEIARRNFARVIDYTERLAAEVRCDLYDPSRDEILLGLLSRVSRLYALILIRPSVWPGDISGILLRCLIESAITFGYLAKNGTEEEFRNFRSYSEGKEKALMLHLQDTYPGAESFEGKSGAAIAEELGGGLTLETMDVELDNWTKKSARDLAFQAGLEDFYRLAYDPASADVHGTWASLRRSNLSRCLQPLHRFHFLPELRDPPRLPGIVDAAQGIYETVIATGVEALGYPPPAEPVEQMEFSDAPDADDQESGAAAT